jgi:Tfp pilus assembly protein PilF
VSRLVAASLVALGLGLATGTAPFQCGGRKDTALRREDTAGDALYDLAQEFRKKGNEQAAKETLRYLVEHYPSNRHVPAARAELEESTSEAKTSEPAEEKSSEPTEK